MPTPTRAAMTDHRLRRVGENQALFRQVNERISDLNESFAAVSDDFTVACECGDLWCTEQITVCREVYEHVRANANYFILKPGHQAADVELVIENRKDFVIVAKKPGPPTQLAEETSPD
ncbi:MAG: hypothetical protein V7644_273 [Actinomycetota bacterium]|jgi:hypothetical protein